MVDKQKASKDVTAAARKRKSLVESDIETLSPSTPGPANKKLSGKSTAKRPKIIKVGHVLIYFISY